MSRGSVKRSAERSATRCRFGSNERGVMRLLYLTVGGSIFDRRFLESFVERGFDTHYVYLRPSGREYAAAGVQEHCLGHDVRRDDRWLSPRVLLHARSYLRFRRLLSDIEPDLLHAGHVQGPGLMAAASGFHPFLLMPWGSDVLIHPERSFLFKWATRFVLRRADLITCDARSVKRAMLDLVDRPAESIRVIPWGIDTALFCPDRGAGVEIRSQLGWSAEDQVIIMTRWLKPVYAVDDFIRALPLVLKRHPRAKALLVGSGPLEDELKGLADELGVRKRVAFLGGVENRDLSVYLNAADVYCSSSLSDGTSASLLEAMACGLPVVVTDVAANREWVEEGVNGTVVPRKDPTALGKALAQILDSSEVRERMGRANRRKVVERADWERNFAEFEELYTQLLPRVLKH